LPATGVFRFYAGLVQVLPTRDFSPKRVKTVPKITHKLLNMHSIKESIMSGIFLINYKMILIAFFPKSAPLLALRIIMNFLRQCLNR
jgi:hypothetical protein